MSPAPEWALDSSVFIYAVGTEHPYREPCRALVAAVTAREVIAHIDTEVLQEVAHVRARRSGQRSLGAALGRQLAAICEVHPVERPDMDLALDLFDSYGGLDMRDAVHAATAQRAGIRTIVASDSGFDEVPGLHRLDPRDAAQMLEGG